ncbi:MAG: TetR/AcrR family transcriptional regulator [Deltaproteobacteria bacterium]|nr:TetR/AcrR family transcriptional regulator [Deltaproteobacteria bacterium]
MGIAERKEREKKERRQKILEAAEKHFSKKGFSRTTMGDIANDIELSPSTLYLYFSNKEELHAALSLKFLENLIEEFDEREKNAEKDPEKRILAIKESLYTLYEYDPLIFMNIFHFQTSEVYKNISEELITQIKDLASRAIRFMSQNYEDGVHMGVFKEMEPIVFADIIWSLFSGLVIWEESKSALDPRKRHMKKTLDRAFEIIMQGIKKA